MIGTEVFDAIKAINPSAKFIVRANSVDQIEWTDGTTPISKSDIEAKMVVLQNEYNNNKYQRDRQKEYPSVVDQLDDIYHNGIDGWKATIKTTKDKYPKP